jgi:hypothetical protein
MSDVFVKTRNMNNSSSSETKNHRRWIENEKKVWEEGEKEKPKVVMLLLQATFTEI